MFSTLNYFKGNFDQCINDQFCPFYYRLNSILYSCDHGFIARSLAKLSESEQVKEPWLSRVFIYKAAIHLLRQQPKETADALLYVDNTSILNFDDTPGVFFKSLYVQLSALQPCVQMGSENVGLIGDSHIFSLSYWVSKIFPPVYIPALQLKYVGQGRESYIEIALSNALTISQKNEELIISIGEIDQRNLYTQPNKLSAYNQILDRGLEWIVDNIQKWQTVRFVELPSFNRQLWIKLGNANIEEMEINQVVNEFQHNFGLKVQSLGSNLVKRNSKTCKLIDDAHYHPTAYHF